LMGGAQVDPEDVANWPVENPVNSTGRRLSERPLDGVELSAWTGLRTEAGTAWTDLCVVDQYIPSNNTLLRHRVTGPEDPKVIAQTGNTALVFSSLPPSNGSEANCRRNPNTGTLSAVTQMYVAQANPSEPSAEATGYRLTYGQTEVAEKNWVPFVKDSTLHFVYQPAPHVILTADFLGESVLAYSTSFRPLQQIVKDKPSIAIRGSGDAVYVDDVDATPNQPRPHYLALLHLHDANTNRYAHFAYRFTAEAPFSILQLSEQLPLTEAEPTIGAQPFAFASGLALQGRTVVITYGAGDRDARALVMTLDRLDEMFSCNVPA